MNSIIEETRNFQVIKTESGYFRSTWNEWDDRVNNYEFTKNPNEASEFDGLDDFAPERMWNKNGETIENVRELCEFLNGKLVEIEVKETIEWREVE